MSGCLRRAARLLLSRRVTLSRRSFVSGRLFSLSSGLFPPLGFVLSEQKTDRRVPAPSRALRELWDGHAGNCGNGRGRYVPTACDPGEVALASVYWHRSQHHGEGGFQAKRNVCHLLGVFLVLGLLPRGEEEGEGRAEGPRREGGGRQRQGTDREGRPPPQLCCSPEPSRSARVPRGDCNFLPHTPCVPLAQDVRPTHTRHVSSYTRRACFSHVTHGSARVAHFLSCVSSHTGRVCRAPGRVLAQCPPRGG